ncbi:MAG: pilus assembly protein PilM [Oscillospiraceae bacterium]|jgi:cell division protein FtsA|nr:pilus assembly protein PilM [Oscillospiraceae bacterium]
MQKKETDGKNDLKPQGDAVFALDIGTRTVVGIIGEQKDDIFAVTDYVVEPHPKRAMIDGQIEDIRQVARMVGRVKEQLQERTGVKLERVSIAAAGRALKTRRVSMDFDISETESINFDTIKSMEIDTIQKASAELSAERSVNTPYYCVGYSIISYLLDNYKMLNLEGHKGSKVTVELIATFLPNVVVEGLYSVMDMNSISVSSLTLEPIAAMNAIIPQEIRLINIALVDIGAGTSDIAVSRDGSIVAYAMATTAGDEITEEIIKTYFVDFDTAETIKQKCCADEECSYRDIFGIERKITPDEFAEKIEPSVDVLAETICANIIEANGGAPSAVFLIGGGSLVKGLAETVSEKLAIPLERVALGSHENLKNIDTKGAVMGAEFVTPLGIAVTGVMNKGYDFSVITLNDRSIRIFDTNKITVFELLTVAGFKSAEILGRSGRNLTYSLNGVRKTKRGGVFEPARVLLGGNPAALSAKVTGGDRVEFTPAVCGENAGMLIRDIIDAEKRGKGTVTLCGSPVSFGLEVKVNGKAADGDYSIQNLDEIETFGILTLGDLLEHHEIAQAVTVNGVGADGDYPLSDGDVVEIRTADFENAPVFVGEEKETDSSGWGEISVTLNGELVALPPNNDKLPHTFLELLNLSKLDFANPQGEYIMMINDAPANFNDELKDGDRAELKWAEAD